MIGSPGSQRVCKAIVTTTAALAAVTVAPSGAEAACSCHCINGRMEQICGSPASVAGFPGNGMPPAVSDRGANAVPTPGAQRCDNEQAWNKARGRYE